ncbi:hypothetical protein ACXR2T_09165 [Leucobacter sp. HY1910]
MLRLFNDAAETLLWCMRPAIDLCHLRGPLPDKLRTLPPEQRPFRPANHAQYNGFLVVTETVNQARAVDPLTADTATPIEVQAPTESARQRVLGAKNVRGAQKRLRKALESRLDIAVADSLENQLFKVALAYSIYQGMNLREYAGVLISSQHSPIMRALAAAAREQQVPVVYVPHAPVATNGAYLDLPVTYAGLRGEGERDFYAERLLVESNALDTVGNLASDVLAAPMPDIDLTGPGVLALSPHPEATIRSIVEAVAGEEMGPMVIAPHPRSDRAVIDALLPTGWAVYEGDRTLDLLRTGPPFLFQFSSGVAWESAALGIPTATVRLSEDAVNYPFLEDESVYPAIRRAADATSFAQRARRGEIDRVALREHALRWCEHDGAAARNALAQLLDRVRSQGAAGRPAQIHDGWGKAGVALSGSWLADTPVAAR